MITARYVVAMALLIPTALCLGGCKADKQSSDKREAGGEVLPGSASDAMLPLDSVRSQPPLAPHSEAPKGSADPSGKLAPAATQAPDSAEIAAPEPKPDAT
jgi:hypothetical protein